MDIEITTGIGGQLLYEETIYKLHTGKSWTDEQKAKRKEELSNKVNFKINLNSDDIIKDNTYLDLNLEKYYINGIFNINVAIQDGVPITNALDELLKGYFQNQRKLEDGIKELWKDK